MLEFILYNLHYGFQHSTAATSLVGSYHCPQNTNTGASHALVTGVHFKSQGDTFASRIAPTNILSISQFLRPRELGWLHYIAPGKASQAICTGISPKGRER